MGQITAPSASASAASVNGNLCTAQQTLCASQEGYQTNPQSGAYPEFLQGFIAAEPPRVLLMGIVYLESEFNIRVMARRYIASAGPPFSRATVIRCSRWPAIANSSAIRANKEMINRLPHGCAKHFRWMDPGIRVFWRRETCLKSGSCGFVPRDRLWYHNCTMLCGRRSSESRRTPHCHPRRF